MSAFNHGLRMSETEYVVYVNSGDELILEGLVSATQMLSLPSVIASAVKICTPTSNLSTLWTGLDPKCRIVQIHQQGTIYKSHYDIHGTYSTI